MRIFSKQKKEFSDAELIDKFISSGDKNYVATLFERYVHLITSIALKNLNNKTEAEDAVMEIFEILLNDIPRQEIKNFSAWLYSVTKNHCLKKHRKLGREMAVEDVYEKSETNFMEFDNEVDLNNKLAKENDLNKLEKAILELKDEQRKCVELFYLKEKSYVEIVKQTGYDLKKVKSYIQNGKRNLKQILESDNT